MKSYLVERDMMGATLDGLGEAKDAAVRYAQEMRTRGTPITYIRTAFVPQDGRCMCFFNAETREAVQALNDDAGLPYLRILDCYDLTP